MCAATPLRARAAANACEREREEREPPRIEVPGGGGRGRPRRSGVAAAHAGSDIRILRAETKFNTGRKGNTKQEPSSLPARLLLCFCLASLTFWCRILRCGPPVEMNERKLRRPRVVYMEEKASLHPLTESNSLACGDGEYCSVLVEHGNTTRRLGIHTYNHGQLGEGQLHPTRAFL